MNAQAENLIERRSANRALLESRLWECVSEIRYLAHVLESLGYDWSANASRAVASRASDALRTIREAEEAK